MFPAGGIDGTSTSVDEMLKVARPKVKVIAVEPVNAAMLKGEEWHPHKT